jgi:hypothetical protein
VAPAPSRSRSPGSAGRRLRERWVLLIVARSHYADYYRSPLRAAIAALLCISLPADGQDNPPDGASKTGTVAPTSVRVSFKEWTAPTPRSFPHDPLAAADGAIWYTGQMASTLGRLDPKTSAFKEYRTTTPDSGPHGLAADKDENIWFTASFQEYSQVAHCYALVKTSTRGTAQGLPAAFPGRLNRN